MRNQGPETNRTGIVREVSGDRISEKRCRPAVHEMHGLGADGMAVNTAKRLEFAGYLKYLRVTKFTSLFANCIRMK